MKVINRIISAFGLFAVFIGVISFLYMKDLRLVRVWPNLDNIRRLDEVECLHKRHVYCLKAKYVFAVNSLNHVMRNRYMKDSDRAYLRAVASSMIEDIKQNYPKYNNIDKLVLMKGKK